MGHMDVARLYVRPYAVELLTARTGLARRTEREK